MRGFTDFSSDLRGKRRRGRIVSIWARLLLALSVLGWLVVIIGELSSGGGEEVRGVRTIERGIYVQDDGITIF